MAQVRSATGRCLCGNVTVSLALADRFDVCHCSTCRRWGGGPMFAVEADGEVRFDGADHIEVFESSDWAERGFCRHCGTHLFYRLKEPVHYALPVGLLDDPGALRFDKEIFVDEQPDSYSFAGDRRRMTGEEVFEEFQAGTRDDPQEST
jgi:hypothetical protein